MVDAERHFLQKEKIYDHLGKIINRVVVEKPQDAHGLVEVLSRLIKEESSKGEAQVDSGNAARGEVPEDVEANASLRAREEVDATLRAKRADYISKVKDLYTEEPPLSEGCEIPDFMASADILSWAGVGFGEMESYRIMTSMNRLAVVETPNGVSSLRLWGKLHGTKADYYVVEAIAEGREPLDDGVTEDPGQEGANKYLYFVTTDLNEPWTKLPEVRPWHIMASRQIKKLLTGDLEEPVITHPLFPDGSLEPKPAEGDDEKPPAPVIGKPGREKQLVRAIIARISADTSVTMKGVLIRDDDQDPPIIDNDEFKYPTTEELSSLDGWIHNRPALLKTIGRTKHLKEDGDDDVDEKQPDREPVPDMIRGLKDDGLKWVVKQFGETRSFRNPWDPQFKERSDVVTALRCLTWPGSITCLKSGLVQPRHTLVNIYVGYGIPSDEPEFFFRAPLDICEEQEVPEEPTEPQGDPDEAKADD